MSVRELLSFFRAWHLALKLELDFSCLQQTQNDLSAGNTKREKRTQAKSEAFLNNSVVFRDIAL